MLPTVPAAALPWLAPYAGIFLLAWRRPVLTAVPPVRGRLVSIVVPARNEAANIATLLESLLRTDYAPCEILVVDDRSTDDTAAIVERFAARDPRVRLVHGAELPPGWYGKPWACLQGYREARGDLLLFTDADTRHAPTLLAHATGALDGGNADLATVVTGQDCLSFWERVVMPHFWVPLGLRYHPVLVNRARTPRQVIANGQFVMVTREAYETAGTHAEVRGAVAEDLALAQAFHRQGLRVRMWWADDLIRTRMYTGLASLVEGWSKNIFLGGRASFPDQPVLRLLAPLILLLGHLFWLAPAALPALTGGAPWSWWAAGLAAGFWTLIAYGMKIPVWYGLTWPLGAAVGLGILIRSTWRGSRRVEWRGRVYGTGTPG
jgi:chlorobactene glucosyltransferase